MNIGLLIILLIVENTCQEEVNNTYQWLITWFQIEEEMPLDCRTINKQTNDFIFSIIF